MESGEPRLALAVEVGPAEISAGFLATVEGRYRFVGEGEAPFRTLSEADEAIVAACAQLEVAVGQKFVDGGQLSVGDGQGPICAVSNSSSPIRVAVIATDRRGSTEVATRALDSVPAVASGVVPLDDRDLQSAEAFANRRLAEGVATGVVPWWDVRDLPWTHRYGPAFHSAEALAYRFAELAVMDSDALLVAGGSDKRDRVALRLAAELLGAMAPDAPEQGPWIVYAGPEQFRNEIEQALHGRLRLQTVSGIIPT
ncbi:MAG: glutamate mutase L, partial [Chloroflexi bacterium]|nr:glutamate mutase L [Chloroflexota bacterium]